MGSDVAVDQPLERALVGEADNLLDSLAILKSSSVGMLRTLKRVGVSGFSSVFIFATTTRPS